MRPRVSSSAFEGALERGRAGDVDLESALTLFRGADTVGRARELFRAATELRDRHLGRTVTLTAHLHMVTRCEVSPPCHYCSLSSSRAAVSEEREKLGTSELLRHVREATDRGVDAIVLVGGTVFDGSDDPVRELLPRVRDATDADLALDIGPSLSEETLRWLARLGVRTVYCSVETVNPRAFAAAKPGDRLATRLQFMDMVDRVGLSLGNVVMNGLGRPRDLIASILHSKRFRHLSHLHISTFQPVPGTPWAGRRPGSVATSLKALAIARLVFPGVQLGLAEVGVEDPKGLRRGPNQLEVGGGNTLAALLIYKHLRIDRLDWVRRRVQELGFTAS